MLVRRAEKPNSATTVSDSSFIYWPLFSHSLFELAAKWLQKSAKRNAGSGWDGSSLGEQISRLIHVILIRGSGQEGDQGTKKVGKRRSRALSKVSATGFIQCGHGMLRQRLPEHATPTLDGGCVKPVAETFERALDMRFPTFIVS